MKKFKILRTFKSRSSSKKHQVRLAADKRTVYCTCRGFIYHGHCWHHDRTMEQLCCGG